MSASPGLESPEASEEEGRRAGGAPGADPLEEVIQHLLFHKAIHDDAPSSDDRISRYIGIARGVEEGSISAYDDPVDRAVATVFELVAKNQMDPWDIDLGEFARLYLHKLAAKDGVDFVVAGRILYLAWSVLKLQSERTVVKFQPPPELPGDLSLDSGDLGAMYEQGALAPEAEVLEPVVRRAPQRPVTLIDLVDAFDEVAREIELRKILEAGRIEAVAELPRFKDRVHSENLEEGITTTWQRIVSHNEEWIPFESIHREGRDDLVTTFIAVLFLSKLGRLDLRQEGPAWKIRVPSMVPGFRRGFLAERGRKKEEPGKEGATQAPEPVPPGTPRVEADGGTSSEDEPIRLGEIFVKNVFQGPGDPGSEARTAVEPAKVSPAGAKGRARSKKEESAGSKGLRKRSGESAGGPAGAASVLSGDPDIGPQGPVAGRQVDPVSERGTGQLPATGEDEQ
jgi:segregation and condensation protein A